MSRAHGVRIAPIILGILSWSASADAQVIGPVSILPTCAITEDDHVTLEMLVVTTSASAFLFQPTQVTIAENLVTINVFVDQGGLGAIDSLFESVDLGRFDVGSYMYTVVVHRPPDVPADIASGSFVIGTQPCEPSPGEGHLLYWTDGFTRTIKRAFQDGLHVEALRITELTSPSAFAVDPLAGKMYWTDPSARRIRRADLDGSAVEDLVVTATDRLPGIALDLERRKLYWTDAGTRKIRRANLNGSAVEDVIAEGLDAPRELAIDPSVGKIYWSDGSHWLFSKIRRANLDGSNVENLVTDILRTPRGLALDLSGGKLYWVERSLGKIQRANLDGSGVEDLVTGLNFPLALSLELVGRKMYWTESIPDIYLNGAIRRANLDGSSVETLVNGLGAPAGIAHVIVRPPIPGVSGRGLMAMVVLLLAAGGFILSRHRAPDCVRYKEGQSPIY